VIDLFGITIHEPDVVFTDLGLALLGAYFAWRLWARRQGWLSRAGGVLMAGLASAAFWGAVFHAFFPQETATTEGFIAWIPVALSILLAAATMLDLGLRLLVPRLTSALRVTILGLYAAAFLTVVFLVDESFGSIVRFYAPALVLFLVGAVLRVAGSRGAGWTSVSAGLLLSAVAALLQQAEISVHPVYFDHNAVYHVLQGIALVFIYLGFRGVPEGGGNAYAAGANPATRPG
jgi:hypothetical protein